MPKGREKSRPFAVGAPPIAVRPRFLSPFASRSSTDFERPAFPAEIISSSPDYSHDKAAG